MEGAAEGGEREQVTGSCRGRPASAMSAGATKAGRFIVVDEGRRRADARMTGPPRRQPGGRAMKLPPSGAAVRFPG